MAKDRFLTTNSIENKIKELQSSYVDLLVEFKATESYVKICSENDRGDLVRSGDDQLEELRKSLNILKVKLQAAFDIRATFAAGKEVEYGKGTTQ